MKKLPLFEWDDETKSATCLLYDKDNVYYGSAVAHPDDYDMANRKTGEHIAYTRALIQALQYERDNEIKPRLAALKQLYYSMNRSKYFNPKSYEAKMLFHQLNISQDDLEQVNIEIRKLKLDLNDFIQSKEIFYKKLRAHRNAKSANSK